VINVRSWPGATGRVLRYRPTADDPKQPVNQALKRSVVDDYNGGVAVSMKRIVLLFGAIAVGASGCAPAIVSSPDAYWGMPRAELLENIQQDKSHQLCSVSEDEIITIHTLEYREKDDVHAKIFSFTDDNLVSIGVRRDLENEPVLRGCLNDR
jgi:hypothetical protein